MIYRLVASVRKIGLPSLLLLLCFTAAGIYFFLQTPVSKPAEFGADAGIERVYWMQRIKSAGDSAAYEELARAIPGLNEGRRYKAAHIFGDALYAVEGARGVGTCDDRFGRGCLHDFMGQAVVREGESAAQQLLDTCNATRPDKTYYCAQALGHGFLVLYGFNGSGLRQSITACGRLIPSQLSTSCYIGVFYEYDLGVDAHEGDVHPQTLNDSTALQPCDEVLGAGKELCFYTRALWWYSVLNDGSRSPEEIVRAMVRNCSFITDPRFLQVCRTGVARYIPQAVRMDVGDAIALCASVFPAPKDALMCRKYGASLVLVEAGPEQALAMCTGLPEADARNCEDIVQHPLYGSSTGSPAPSAQ